MSAGLRRQLVMLCAWILTLTATQVGLLANFAEPAAAGPDDFVLTKIAPADALIGETITFTLTASGTQGTNLYNLGFRDVLPPGVEFVVGSGDPEPIVIANEPSAGFTTLLWENVSDLASGAESSITYDVDTDPDTDPSTLPVGSVFTNEASAYAHSDAFTLPDVDPDTGEFVGDFTGEASAAADVEVIAYRLTKLTSESEMLRGVHETSMGTAGGTIGGLFTLQIEGNPNYPNSTFTVTDTLPPELEFLGCDNYYGPDDHSTDVPFNGAAADDEEWPDSGPMATHPDSGNCAVPNSVETIADGSTQVSWTFPALPPSGTVAIDYGAGIPLRSNCDTFTSGSAPGGLTQGFNLDNNCGDPTSESDLSPWPNPAAPELLTTNELPFENTAEVCGSYGEPTVGGYDPCQQDSIVTSSEDIRLNKSSAGVLEHDEIITYTLIAQASEYRDFSNLTFRDLLPDGLCFTGTYLADTSSPASDWATEDCGSPVASSTTIPTISVDGGAPVNAPASTVAELPDGRTEITWDVSDHPNLASLPSDSTVTVSFEALVRSNYRENGDPVGAVLSGDSVINEAEVSGFDSITGENTNTESIDPEVDDPANNPEGDTAETGLDTPLPSIKKYVAVKDPGPLDENTAPIPFVASDCVDEYTNIMWEDSAGGGPAPTDVYVDGYGPGDIVCFLMTADFPNGLSYDQVQVTDLLPTGYTYVPGSASSIGVSTTNTNPTTTIPPDDVGGTVTTETDRRVVVDIGAVDSVGRSFTWVIAAVLGPPGSNEAEDIIFNQQKMTTANSNGGVFQFRDMAGAVWEEPELQLAKGIDAITSVSDDVNAPGPQGIDFDSSFPSSDPTPQLVENDAIVDYRIDVWNEGNRDAVNAEIWDVLPAGITCADIVSGSLNPATGSCDPVDNTIKWPGDLVIAEDYPNVSFEPDPGQFVTYTYSVLVPGTVVPGSLYENHAGIRSYETVINTSGDAYEYLPEENIDPTVTGNTEPADDEAAIYTELPTIEKTQWSGIDAAGNSSNGAPAATADQVTIGEIVQYGLQINIPEGSSIYGGEISDALPPGITYFEGLGLFDGTTGLLAPTVSVVDDGTAGSVAANNAACATDPSVADLAVPTIDTNGTVTLTFPCEYENAAGSGDDIVEIIFYAQVDDIAATTAGTIFDNQADFSWTEADGTGGDSVESNETAISVVEPNPQLDKTHTTPGGGSNSILPGDNAVWELSAANPTTSNTSTLYDIVIVDQVPAVATPLATPGGSPVTATGDTVEGPGGAIGVWDNTARTITWSIATPWSSGASPHELESLPPDGAPIVLDFEVEFDGQLPLGTVITNTADVFGDSLPHDDPSNDESNQDARNYTDDGEDDLEVVEPFLVKDVEPFGEPDVDAPTFTVGEPVEYSIAYTIPTSTVAYDATLFDQLPSELTFDTFGTSAIDATPSVGPNCFTGDLASVGPAYDGADAVLLNPTNGDPQKVSWYLGDIVANGGDCDITVAYTVHVNDTAFDGDTISNDAEAAWNAIDEVDDASITDQLDENYDDPEDFLNTHGPVVETFDVVEPQLVVDKDVQELPGPAAIAPCDTTGGNNDNTTDDPDGTPGTSSSGVTDGDGCDVEAEETVRYTLTVTSTGTSPAHDIAVIDNVPTGITPLGAGGVPVDATNTTIPSTIGGVTGTWDDAARTIAWVLPGPVTTPDSLTIDYDATLASSDDLQDEEDLTNTVTIDAYFGLPEDDRDQIVTDNPDNDDLITYGNGDDAERGDVTDDVTTVEVHFPELEITKAEGATSDPTDARIDEPFTWNLVITNTDPVASAYNVDAVDTLPPGWTYVPGSAQVSVDGAAATNVEPTSCVADSGACNDPAALNVETLTWADLVLGFTQPLEPNATIEVEFQAIPRLEALGDPSFWGTTVNHTNQASTTGEDQSGSNSCCGGTTYGDDTTHDVNVQAFDLALEKIVTSVTPDPVQVGSVVNYTILVTNQGSVDAYDIELADYVQSQFVYNASDNTAAATGNPNDWTGSSPLVATELPFVAAGTTEAVTLELVVATPPAPGDQIHNFAEISAYDDDDASDNTAPNDIDSDEDTTNDEWDENDPDNDATVDGEVDNAGGDEDDHDVASIPSFDLALQKRVRTVSPTPMTIGSTVIFEIEVFNQGSEIATDVTIVDYIYPGFGFDPADNTGAVTGNANDWSGGPTIATVDVGTINPAESTVVEIRLEITDSVAPLQNFTEVASADNDGNPANDPPVDIDSVPDTVDDDTFVDDELDETGISVTGPTGDDEDDHDGVIIPVFDLALRKTMVSVTPTPLAHGSVVRFQIEVFNQGSIDATDITIADYLGDGWTFDPAANTAAASGNTEDWDGTDPNNPTLLVGDIAAGSSETVVIDVTFTHTPVPAGQLANAAEIISADDDGNPANDPPVDIDSVSDTTRDDTVTDDEIDESGIDDEGVTGDDEDDHDIHNFDVFDLALQKRVSLIDPDPVKIESKVTFEVEVFNQGSIDATDITITDYVQTGFSFDPAVNTAAATGNPADWDGTDPANPTTTIPALASGDSVVLTIVLELEDDEVLLGNLAEISSYDDDGDEITDPPIDVDSVADASDDDPTVDDELLNDGGDEDDHDIATLQTWDFALRKTFASSDPNPVRAGSIVTFNIEVFNQGSVDATDVTITDYVHAGYLFDPSDNTAAATGNPVDWDGTDPTNPTLDVGPLSAGASTVATINLYVEGGAAPLNNGAEITYTDNDANPATDPPVDIDSTTDDTRDNDNYEDDVVDENGVDDETGDGTADEDDHDAVILPVFDLAVRKTTASVDADPAADGSKVTYEIEVLNQGSIDASDVTLTDYVQTGLAFDPADNTAAATGNPVDWDGTDPANPTLDVGPLLAGETTTVIVVLTIPTVPATPNVFENLVEVSSYDDDGDETTDPPVDIDSIADGDGTNDDLEDNEIGENGITDVSGDGTADEDDHDIAQFTSPTFDLALMKKLAAETPTPVDIDDDITFEITVINQGDIDATNIEITDYLPESLVVSSADTNGWVDNGDGTATAAVAGPLAPGEQTTISLVATIQAGSLGPQVNEAEISEASDINGTPRPDLDSVADTNNTNDTGGEEPDNDVIDGAAGDEDDHDLELFFIREVDLSLEKLLVGVATEGETAEWSITVNNAGPDDSIAATTVTDVLQDGLTYDSSSGDGWTCSAVDQTVTCESDADIPAGGTSDELRLFTTVSAAAGTSLSNAANVSTPEGETDASTNNSGSTEGTPVQPEPPASIPDLAFTGRSSWIVFAGATAMIGAGWLTLGYRRRRHATPAT